MTAAQDRLIVALDYPSRGPALALVRQLGPAVQWYKVGLELYLAEGAPIVHALAEQGKSVFLDLKLHDIPNTVAGAVRSAAQTGAKLLTVHAGGGPAMLQAAAEAAADTALELLAVTVLTSMDDAQLRATGVDRSAWEQVVLLGSMALEAGVRGLVCSPLEAARMRAAAGPEPLLVVPGIRNRTVQAARQDDQRRIATASEAVRAGASKIVVGRPITQAAEPVETAMALLEEIAAELAREPAPVLKA